MTDTLHEITKMTRVYVEMGNGIEGMIKARPDLEDTLTPCLEMCLTLQDVPMTEDGLQTWADEILIDAQAIIDTLPDFRTAVDTCENEKDKAALLFVLTAFENMAKEAFARLKVEEEETPAIKTDSILLRFFYANQFKPREEN